MRVIAGEFRSRALTSPAGLGTRPTSDRLRETLFNVLAARRELAGLRFADLYAGTGAVGIEALSRGAAFVAFAEKDAAALKSLRANLKTLGVGAARFQVEERGTAKLLAGMPHGTGMDIVFLDPPFEAEAEYEATMTTLGSKGANLSRGAVVVVEHRTRAPMAERYGLLHRGRVVRQGDVSLSFFDLPGGEDETA